MTLIDVHGHWGPWFFAMSSSSVSENLRIMDEWGIDLQIVSAVEAITYDAPAGNAKLAALLQDQPRLRGYVVANPNNLSATEADLHRYLGTEQFVGVKVHTTYPGREVSSPQMRDLFALLNQYHAVVLIHTWGPDVLHLVTLLADNPQLRVIAAHMGGNRWDLATVAACQCQRLYLEPSGSITDAGQVAYVAARVPATQLLFGTDATLLDPAVSVGLITDAQLNPHTKSAMSWRNAANLFNLHSALTALR